MQYYNESFHFSSILYSFKSHGYINMPLPKDKELNVFDRVEGSGCLGTKHFKNFNVCQQSFVTAK